jgi:Protein of unknown function (DUF3987)
MSNDTLAEKLASHERLIAPVIRKELERIQTEATEEVIHDDFIPPPEPTAELFYGLVGRVAHVAAEGTEANPVAAATSFLSFLGANVGRDTFLSVANTYHHARLFTLHVGRSGLGRKGDSQQLTLRIRQQVESLDKKLLGGLHTGGLSSREGVATLIQDAEEGKNGTEDKRLWVIESEFANVLSQTKRDGNTLSSALRDAWDGGDIKPAVKNGRTWVTSPHIGIHGNITPSELKSLLLSREMNNGFFNRFLVVWAESTVHIAFPQATPGHIVEALALEIKEILYFAKGKYPDTQNTHEMYFSAAAMDYYKTVYPTLRQPLPSEFITSLLERRAPYMLRLGMLFALTDKARVIEERHLRAALAWVNYAVQSIRYIFQDQAKSEGSEETKRNAGKIVAFLDKYPEGCTASKISVECFNKNLPSDKINKAFDLLLSDIPKRLERLAPKNGIHGRKPILYRKIGTKETKELQTQSGRGLQTIL